MNPSDTHPALQGPVGLLPSSSMPEPATGDVIAPDAWNGIATAPAIAHPVCMHRPVWMVDLRTGRIVAYPCRDCAEAV